MIEQQEYMHNKKEINVEIDKLRKLGVELKAQYILSESKRLNVEIGKQYMYKDIKVWIYDFQVGFKGELSCCLKKVKKDGTNGNSIENSYGVNADTLKELK